MAKLKLTVILIESQLGNSEYHSITVTPLVVPAMAIANPNTLN